MWGVCRVVFGVCCIVWVGWHVSYGVVYDMCCGQGCAVCHGWCVLCNVCNVSCDM